MIKHYSSLTEFLDLAQYTVTDFSQGKSWDAGISGVKAIDLARNGDPSLVKAAEMVTDKIEIQTLETEEAQFIASQYGRRPHVPSFIAGNPLSMRRRVRTHTEGKVVNVCVNIDCGASVSASDMLRRGAAIIGLVQALQRAQARVDLSLVYGQQCRTADDGERWEFIHIDSTPIDLSVVGFALAHPAFMRNVVIGFNKKLGGNPHTILARNHGLDSIAREYLGLSDADVYVPRSSSSTMSVFRDPTAWVQAKLTQVASS